MEGSQPNGAREEGAQLASGGLLEASRRLPPYIGDILEDRAALLALVAACLALAAAGLDPHVVDPESQRATEAIAERPATAVLLGFIALLQAAFILAGGAIADIWRSTRILRAALIGLVVAAIGASLMPTGVGLLLSRVLAWAADGLIIPFAIGSIALRFHGAARATALGVLFGVYGLATMIARTALTIFGPDGPEIPAFALCAGVALVAFGASGRWMTDLPGALPSQRSTIALTAVWAFGAICVLAGILWLGPWVVVAGVVLIAGSLLARRVSGRSAEEGVEARPAGAALVAGLVIGLSKAVPLVALPYFFRTVQEIHGIVGNLLIAPFVVTTFVVGPLSGWLLTRMSPRKVILGGMWLIAAANIAFFVLLGRNTSYFALIIPFALVGAGFAVATAVRTAVIFSCTPRRLPATAAALNEAAMSLGTRMGITVFILLGSGATADLTEVAWMRASVLIAGVMAAVFGPVIFLLMGPLDPVRTVWDLREERARQEPSV